MLNMVENIPDFKELEALGIEYSLIGYEEIMNLVEALRNYDDDYLIDGDVEEYWNRAKSRLMIHSSLIHQGIDFILKSKIAKTSPFLLLSNNPDKYPKLKNGQVDYSDFYMIESSKLLVVHDYFCNEKLNDDFKIKYENNRKIRNKTMHTLDRNLKIEATKVLRETIQILIYLTGEKWLPLRLAYLRSKADFSLCQYSNGFVESLLLSEILLLKDILTNNDYYKIVGSRRKDLLYLCPNCFNPDHACEIIGSCVYDPPNNDEGNIRCLICEDEFEVIVKKCSEKNCCSNIFYKSTEQCCLCHNMF